ncbi:tRNA uridine-5-carboxymethylaminomethyl(34) synthesis GTPase MnmE [Beggiatoa leptomitoformis]|uniref:tRNA modification GTPase MnmE n=1 Tax=Beggiatoa leptomitoformis TaxID=288004 RepID=A0A2N9YD15_9GAMM|nr:tRNA uridine-5-carboxymethylaminomethyl(34) synthesis GTPase MnmE [Beggiatoa leptomitoformis]ALG69214.1 tRNA uridine-5-carboxymethylaminomethyl(34) synthesis GTPase MnmE [Beggiatoa leptomitoformis]AUI68350.1 tRNA uridine-5-carboxymethylaminomethyl(34) synthesis GTPase MnmE [Beggiatoa leptomitoformis]
MLNQFDTIAAIATPAGRGGVGVVRVSGTLVPMIAQAILHKVPNPRYATYSPFVTAQNALIDQGIALYFPAPNSFTGEAVLELQGHGGAVVMDQLLSAVLAAGARLAQPGEFSERAFLNGKIDLTQAEAIADLIDSASVQAMRSALRSLQGEFSHKINALLEQLILLRTYIEAGIDFVDEEIDLLADGQVQQKLSVLKQTLQTIFAQAQQGFLLNEGVKIALVGEPNVGKSSLLNCLAGRETAIVTPIAGTTRDIVRDQIQLDGMPLHIIDTAGLRETTDIVEQEGIRRTKLALEDADLVILLLDDRYADDQATPELLASIPSEPLIIRNKIDLSNHAAGVSPQGMVYISAKTGAGVDALKDKLRQRLGVQTQTEGTFIARRRHLEALKRTLIAVENAMDCVTHYQNELVAEELRLAQQALGEITGEFTSDDLLGKIFSTFCIGK